MKVIGIGDLVCDLYYLNNEFVGLSGGKSFANIVFNLAHLNIPTAVIGSCGNNEFGEIAIDSLKKSGVDTTSINILDSYTKLFHINIEDKNISTRSICPLCHSKKKYKSGYNGFNLDDNDIVVIDSIIYLKHLKSQKTIMLDIGYYNELEKLSDDEINDFFKFPFTIINMNSRVSKYLISRLKLKSEKELYKILKTKLLIITKGKKGASYYYKNADLHIAPQKISKEVDPSGAGDLFFAFHIKGYILNEFKVNSALLKKCFENATCITNEVVKLVGARSHYQDLYHGNKINNYCICQKIISYQKNVEASIKQ